MAALVLTASFAPQIRARSCRNHPSRRPPCAGPPRIAPRETSMTRPTHESLISALALAVAFAGVAHAQPSERANPLVLAQAPPQTEQEKAKRKEQERQKGPPPGGERKAFPDKGPPAKAQNRKCNATPRPAPGRQEVRRAARERSHAAQGTDRSAAPLRSASGRPTPGGEELRGATGPQGDRAAALREEEGARFHAGHEEGAAEAGESQPAAASRIWRATNPERSRTRRGADAERSWPGAATAGCGTVQATTTGRSAARGSMDVQKARKERVEAGWAAHHPGAGQPLHRQAGQQGRHPPRRRPSASAAAGATSGRSVGPTATPRRSMCARRRCASSPSSTATGGWCGAIAAARTGANTTSSTTAASCATSAIGVGVGAVGLAILDLAPPRVTIPREKYIVDYGRASEDDLYEAFDAPPDRQPRARLFAGGGSRQLRAAPAHALRRAQQHHLRVRRLGVDARAIPASSSAWRAPCCACSGATPTRCS